MKTWIKNADTQPFIPLELVLMIETQRELDLLSQLFNSLPVVDALAALNDGVDIPVGLVGLLHDAGAKNTNPQALQEELKRRL